MENKIIRECVQGLIDDSKMIDDLCEKLDTERINLVKVVDDLDSGSSLTHRDAIDDIMEKVRSAQRKIQNAQSYAEEAKSSADYACDDANEADYDCDNIMDMCRGLIKDIELKEQPTPDADKAESQNEEEVSEEQKEINNSNQYETINN